MGRCLLLWTLSCPAHREPENTTFFFDDWNTNSPNTFLRIGTHLQGIVREEEADDVFLLVSLAQGSERGLRVGEVPQHLPVVVQELLQAVVGVLGAVLLPLPLGPDGLPGHLVGVDGGGLHGGELHPLAGKVGARKLITAGQNHLAGKYFDQVLSFPPLLF